MAMISIWPIVKATVMVRATHGIRPGSTRPTTRGSTPLIGTGTIHGTTAGTIRGTIHGSMTTMGIAPITTVHTTMAEAIGMVVADVALSMPVTAILELLIAAAVLMDASQVVSVHSLLHRHVPRPRSVLPIIMVPSAAVAATSAVRQAVPATVAVSAVRQIAEALAARQAASAVARQAVSAVARQVADRVAAAASAVPADVKLF